MKPSVPNTDRVAMYRCLFIFELNWGAYWLKRDIQLILYDKWRWNQTGYCKVCLLLGPLLGLLLDSLSDFLKLLELCDCPSDSIVSLVHPCTLQRVPQMNKHDALVAILMTASPVGTYSVLQKKYSWPSHIGVAGTLSFSQRRIQTRTAGATYATPAKSPVPRLKGILSLEGFFHSSRLVSVLLLEVSIRRLHFRLLQLDVRFGVDCGKSSWGMLYKYLATHNPGGHMSGSCIVTSKSI